MNIYEENNERAYNLYKIETAEQKAFVLKVLEKYGLSLNKPKSRLPFFIHLDGVYGAKEFEVYKDFKWFGEQHIFLAPLKNLEDDILIQTRVDLAFKSYQLNVISCYPPEYIDIVSNLFKTQDGRIFSLTEYKSEKSTNFYTATFRSGNYFDHGRAKKSERVNVPPIDYIPYDCEQN